MLRGTSAFEVFTREILTGGILLTFASDSDREFPGFACVSRIMPTHDIFSMHGSIDF